MFDIGFWELALVFGLGLIILGPERLPRVAAQLARWVNKARRTAMHLRRQLERELELEELINPRSSSRPTPPAGPQRGADGKFPDEQTGKSQSSYEEKSKRGNTVRLGPIDDEKLTDDAGEITEKNMQQDDSEDASSS